MDVPTRAGVATAVVAAVALFRPEAEWVVRSFRTKLSVLLVQRVEIGFAEFGPTIGIYGSLYAVSRPHLVNNMAVRLTRLRDGAQHELPWMAIRPTNVMPAANPQIEIATPFVVGAGVAHKFNILFNDQQTLNLITPEGMAIRQGFLQYLQQNNHIWASAAPADQLNWRNAYRAAFRQQLAQHYQNMLVFFYWEVGRFSVELKTFSDVSERPVVTQFQFDLTQADVATLRANVVGIMESGMLDSAVLYGFANPVRI